VDAPAWAGTVERRLAAPSSSPSAATSTRRDSPRARGGIRSRDAEFTLQPVDGAMLADRAPTLGFRRRSPRAALPVFLEQRRFAARFDVQANQRLGVGHPQVEPPVGKSMPTPSVSSIASADARSARGSSDDRRASATFRLISPLVGNGAWLRRRARSAAFRLAHDLEHEQPGIMPLSQ
jgi:hypothetical protein